MQRTEGRVVATAFVIAAACLFLFFFCQGHLAPRGPPCAPSNRGPAFEPRAQTFAFNLHEQGPEQLLEWWSKGPSPHTAYNLLSTERRSSKAEIFAHVQATLATGADYVWIRVGSPGKQAWSDVETFSELLDHVPKDIVLVTSDGDRSVPSELRGDAVRRICEHSRVRQWHTQNYDGTDTSGKIRPRPIGLDLHARSWLGRPPLDGCRLICEIRDKPRVQLDKILCDVYASANDRFGGQRKRIVATIRHRRSAFIDMPRKRLGRAEILQLYAQYRYVVSPPGNGMDCHRTWEVLAVGSMPIIKRGLGGLDAMWEKVPSVALIDDWDDLFDASLFGIAAPPSAS